jgi:hypothetical protein
MKIFLFAACASLLSLQTFAQETPANTGNAGTLDYWEPNPNDGGDPKLFRQLRHTKMYIQLDLTEGGVFYKKLDATYFVTKLQQTDAGPVVLNSVECKLYPYYPVVFEMKLLVFQVNNGDTVCQVVPIEHRDRKAINGIATVQVSDKNIRLNPGDFYIGFGFTPKDIPEAAQCRMYINDKGTGAIISLPATGGAKITEAPGMPYKFPFKINYSKA